MPRGRPIGSEVRQNLVELLNIIKGAYGYELFKLYREIFPRTTMRNVYYHLKKGVDLEEFQIQKVQQEKGNYSWGSTAEKIYYTLGQEAKPQGKPEIKTAVNKILATT